MPAANPFFFALEFSSQGVPLTLLSDLAAHVLEHVGASPELLPKLVEALQDAVSKGTAGARSDVRFQAQPGRLEVVVSSNGGRVWQTSVPIS